MTRLIRYNPGRRNKIYFYNKVYNPKIIDNTRPFKVLIKGVFQI